MDPSGIVTVLDSYGPRLGELLVYAVLARTLLQASVSVLDALDERFPRIAPAVSLLAGMLDGVDQVVRVFGVKSMQGSARALRKVVNKP